MQDPTTRPIGDLIPTIGGSGARVCVECLIGKQKGLGFRGHRGCTRRCLSRAGVLGSLTRPAVRGVGGGFRSRELLPGQTAADRPDLVARVFNMKLDALLTDLWATGIFGHVLARVHTVRVPLDYL